MDKVVNKTINAIARFGERLERRLSNDESDDTYLQPSESDSMFPSTRSGFYRPLDGPSHKRNAYSSQRRDLSYGGARKYSSDNLAASPGYESFSNYRQSPMSDSYRDDSDRSPYGAGIGALPNYGSYSGGYPNPSSTMPYGFHPGSVAYAPNYYIAERRQVDLVPAPPPRVIREPVPVPVPVDRPVPQPYPVEVLRHVPIDRPVPVPVPSPVPVDRFVPVPVPVPSPPVCVPVPVPNPVPYYVPVGVPVPSPRASPVMFEQSVTHTQRWTTGSPVIMNQQQYYVSPPAMGINPYVSYGNGPFIR
ncbi:unnamed protein product [Rotaria sp. Silwood1]|nr:unnamed protein product [Rotaria sp. Silwood1]CAF0907338.1 unnamed protein product [Rotaria sp. Silwood1]CAF3390633.1 unnamed protein product [Rotaria sp. Silwood1]CAF3392310.1 unnamed protein product [Rotaria sp. Silwood1]CAF4519012.1 unnamed protein product [Rotaria sp. Silwood1]